MNFKCSEEEVMSIYVYEESGKIDITVMEKMDIKDEESDEVGCGVILTVETSKELVKQLNNIINKIGG